MRTSWLLIAAAAIVAGNYNVVSAVSDVNQDNLVSPNNGQVKRLLRANKEVKEDEERVAPGAGMLDFTKTASLKYLEDLAAELAVVRQPSKIIKDIQDDLDWTLINVAVRKWTPESVEEKLNIAVKRATMTDDELMRDPDYLFSKLYKEFWDARKAKA